MNAQPPLDEQAAAWLVERDEGFAPARAEAFSAWCAADPRHAAAVRQIERAMDLLETIPSVRRALEARFGPLPPAPATPEVSTPTSVLRPPVSGVRAPSSAVRSFGRRRIAPLALAAALVLGLAVTWYYATRVAGRAHFVNGTASPQQLTLRDGSTVHLDAHSALRVDFSGPVRRVRLEAGRAHFEVAHDAVHTFIASAAGVTVRAIGTAFSVRLASATVEVLVEEGRVEVAPAAAPPARAAVSAAPPPQLTAGERAVVARATDIAVTAPPRIEKVEAPELREALAWHRRTVVLSDVPLAEVIARFNRRNAIQLVMADSDLRDRRVGGVLALDQVESFVAMLESGGDIVAERRNAEQIVLRRAR